MKSLVQEDTLRELCARIDRLPPDARPQWGKMNAHQAIRHLEFTLGKFLMVASGGPLDFSGLKISGIKKFFGRYLIKWLALYVVKEFPKGKVNFGLPPPSLDGRALNEDKKLLKDQLKQIQGMRDEELRLPHPLFGPLTLRQWHVFIYKHCDHHLRQFAN